MSAETRAQLEKLRRKCAHTFRVDINKVFVEEWQDYGEGKVWADGLPVWTINQSEAEYFAGDGIDK